MDIGQFPQQLQQVQFPGGAAVPFTVFKGADGILFAYGASAPADASVGYAPGCIFIDTVGSPNVYINTGTAANATFKAITHA